MCERNAGGVRDPLSGAILTFTHFFFIIFFFFVDAGRAKRMAAAARETEDQPLSARLLPFLLLSRALRSLAASLRHHHLTSLVTPLPALYAFLSLMT